MHRPALLVGALAFGVTGADAFAAGEADFEAATTGQLATLCGTDPSHENAREALSFCHGFIGGAAVVYLEMVRGGLLNQLVCAPDGITSGDIAAQLVAWAAANPDKAETSVEDGLFESAAAKWPCP